MGKPHLLGGQLKWQGERSKKETKTKNDRQTQTKPRKSVIFLIPQSPLSSPNQIKNKICLFRETTEEGRIKKRKRRGKERRVEQGNKEEGGKRGRKKNKKTLISKKKKNKKKGTPTLDEEQPNPNKQLFPPPLSSSLFFLQKVGEEIRRQHSQVWKVPLVFAWD